MRPFLERNTQPYLDCYVQDKFRGQIHCGIHLTRLDVVQAMRQVEVDPTNKDYVLRPEFYIREQALKSMGLVRVFKPFAILHDFAQYYKDVFSKYVVREFRSRSPHHQTQLAALRQTWQQQATTDLDYQVAIAAIDYARQQVPPTASSQEIQQVIARLPELGPAALAQLAIAEKTSLNWQEVDSLKRQFADRCQQRPSASPLLVVSDHPAHLRQLTLALNRLGFSVTYDPTQAHLIDGLLQPDATYFTDFDGIADARLFAVSESLQQRYPQARWIVTTEALRKNSHNTQALLRQDSVRLLTLETESTLTWEPLCQFLGQPIPDRPV
jgi:hypothetical protein